MYLRCKEGGLNLEASQDIELNQPAARSAA